MRALRRALSDGADARLARRRPSKLPQYVADYMGHRFQDPAPEWEPPQDNGGAPPAPDAGASPF